MTERESVPVSEMLEEISHIEPVKVSSVLLEQYFGDEESQKALLAKIEQGLMGELRESRIASDRSPSPPPRRRFLLPWILLPVLLVIVMMSLYFTRRLFSDSLPGIERDALEYGSTEGYILDILRRESERKLDQRDASVSRYLGELDELESRRILLVSEFAFSLVHRAEDLDEEYAARLEQERAALVEKHGLDTAAFQEAFTTRRSALLRERAVEYDRFRRLRLTQFEKEQTEILSRRQDLEHGFSRQMLAESAAGTAGIGLPSPAPLEIPPAELPPPLFSLPQDLKRVLESGLPEEAASAVEELLTELYPDNSEYRAVQRTVRLAAAKAAAEAAAETETETDRIVRMEIDARVSAFLEALSDEPLLSDRRIESLSETHGGGDPLLSETLASIARALRTAGANVPTTDLSYQGTVAIYSGGRIVVELSGKDKPVEGNRILVRRRTPDGGESPVAAGVIVAVFGSSAEARIEELYDDRVSPSLMDRVYLIKSR